MNSSFSSIEAAVATVSANASAGISSYNSLTSAATDLSSSKTSTTSITSSRSSNVSQQNFESRPVCTHNQSNKISNIISPVSPVTTAALAISNSAYASTLPANSFSHQIGTNMSELSVCWHKTTDKHECTQCGEPFYEANQFSCPKCTMSGLLAGLALNDHKPLSSTNDCSSVYDSFSKLSSLPLCLSYSFCHDRLTS